MYVRSLYYVCNEYVLAVYCLSLFCMNNVGFTKLKCTVNKGFYGMTTRTTGIIIKNEKRKITLSLIEDISDGLLNINVGEYFP